MTDLPERAIEAGAQAMREVTWHAVGVEGSPVLTPDGRAEWQYRARAVLGAAAEEIECPTCEGQAKHPGSVMFGQHSAGFGVVECSLCSGSGRLWMLKR